MVICLLVLRCVLIVVLCSGAMFALRIALCNDYAWLFMLFMLSNWFLLVVFRSTCCCFDRLYYWCYMLGGLVYWLGLLLCFFDLLLRCLFLVCWVWVLLWFSFALLWFVVWIIMRVLLCFFYLLVCGFGVCEFRFEFSIAFVLSVFGVYAGWLRWFGCFAWVGGCFLFLFWCFVCLFAMLFACLILSILSAYFALLCGLWCVMCFALQIWLLVFGLWRFLRFVDVFFIGLITLLALIVLFIIVLCAYFVGINYCYVACLFCW